MNRRRDAGICAVTVRLGILKWRENVDSNCKTNENESQLEIDHKMVVICGAERRKVLSGS